MKYYSTGKKGFRKAWFKAGLDNWALFFLDLFGFIWLLNFLGEDFTQYNVQLVAFATVVMLSISYFFSRLFIGGVLDYMEEHDYMTTDKKRKNFYKNNYMIKENQVVKDDDL